MEKQVGPVAPLQGGPPPRDWNDSLALRLEKSHWHEAAGQPEVVPESTGESVCSQRYLGHPASPQVVSRPERGLPSPQGRTQWPWTPTPVYEKRRPKWCIASPGGSRRVQTYPGLGSTTMMPFPQTRESHAQPDVDGRTHMAREPQTWYEVHVLCFSNFGDGQEAVQTVLTHPENLTAEGDIDPPGGLEAEPTSSRSIHLSWRAPVPAQNISYYTVRYSAVRPKSVHNSSMVQYIPSTKTEVVVADLQPSTLYGFAVKSHGADSHMSHFSQLIECKTSEDKPTAPRDITWAPLDLGSIRVHWQAPEFPNGVIQNYHIFYNACEPDVTQMDKWLTRSEPGTRLTSVLNGLAINTVYSLRLQAQTSAGLGPLTQVIKFVISVPSPSTSSPHPQAAGQQDEDPSLGILLGVAAGLLCMTLCAIIILYKNKKCSNTNEDSTSEGRLASQSCFATLFSRRKTPATPRELELLSSPPNASEDHLDTKGGYPQCNGKTNGHAKDKRLRDVTLNGHVGNGSAVHTTNSSPPCYNNRDPESRLPLPRSQHRYDASDCFLQTEGGPWTEGRTSAPTPLLGDHSSAAWRDIEEPTTAAEEEQATLETIVSADNSFVSHRDVASDTTNTSVHPEA
ncbi:protogenin [Ixodes scapularis]